MTRLLPLGFTLIGISILLGLGTWQMQRLAWKNDLIARRDTALAEPPIELPGAVDDWRAYDFRIIKLSGRFHHDLEQLIGVETKSGTLGHHVLTPLTRSNGMTILVDRGWVSTDKADPAARPEGQQKGDITLTGIARYRSDDRPGWFTPSNEPGAKRWYHYDLAAMEDALGIDLVPLVVEADATPNPGGLPIGGRTRTALTNNHWHYAMTWYGLAAALLGVYIVFHLQQTKLRKAS